MRSNNSAAGWAQACGLAGAVVLVGSVPGQGPASGQAVEAAAEAASSAEASATGAALDSQAGVMAGPIAVEPVFLDTQWGPIRGFLVTVDLTDPRVEVVVSGGAAETLPNPEAEVVLQPTDAFVAESGCALAVNANFFQWKEDATGKKSLANIVGLSITDGEAVSGPREHGGEGDPALVFDKQGRAAVLDVDAKTLTQQEVWDGVAGIGLSDSDATPGTLLVIDGVNHGGTARPGPTVRHPRTAAGVDRAGETLILAVIDGRQPGHSIGITLVELAALMISAGADDAVNLDGGGSTAVLCHVTATSEPDITAVLDGDGDGWITNRPSDGRYRPVANHLGIRLTGWASPGVPGPIAPAVSIAPTEEHP